MLEKIGLPAKPAQRGSSWVVDASLCQGCSSQFTFINRKHHCRRCGGLFCNNCTLLRMVLRGQGDSPVRICEPCKKLEEAARFEMRYGHKNKTGRGGSKLTSRHEDGVLNQILGGDGSSTANMVSRLERDTSSASYSSIQEIPTHNDSEVRSISLFNEESSQVLAEGGSVSPEELRQQALNEKKKYKILKAEGKSEEALRAFKRGKELERQAGALELSLRKSRKKALSSSSTAEIPKNNDDNTHSDRKNKLFPQKTKEKDDLAAELRKLGWSDMDLHDADKKPASISLEGEFSTLLGELSKKSNTEMGRHGIDKTQVIAHKQKALMLKREGKLAEAKEELKKAKVLERQFEEEELLAGAEDSDDEFSALIRSIDIDKQDNLFAAYEPDTGFDLGHLMGITDDLGVDGNFEVNDEDMDDPEIAAALKSLGWADEGNHSERIEARFVPVDKDALLSEIQSMKREALNQKRAGNAGEALELLKKAKVLEKDLDNFVTQGADTITHNPSILQLGSTVQSAENLSKPNEDDGRNVHGMGKAEPKLTPKNRLVIQKELLALKKRALALRREGKLDEADEELKKGKVLEQQLEDMDNASKVNVTPVSVSKNHGENIALPDFADGGEGDVTDQDMLDPTYLALLRNLGWKDEDDKHVIPSKPAKQSGNLSEQKLDSIVTQPANSIQIRASRKSKGEIQRELLGLKRKALVLRRQGETEEAEEVLKMTKILETELAEIEMPKNEAQSEISKPVENDPINLPHKNAVGAVRGAPEDGMQDPVLRSLLKNLESKDDVEPATMQEKSSKQMTDISIHAVYPCTEDLGSKNKITYEKREEIVPMNQKPHIDESDSVGGAVYQNDQSSVRKEILILKRKAVALKREGKLAEAREELRQAKLLEKSLEDSNPHPGSSSSEASSSTSNITSVVQKEHSPPNLAPKPLSSRERFKLQQESLSHKRLALKLRREGRTEEAEAEFELAKSLETQLEQLAANDTAKPVEDVGVEDFMDPQLLSALKAIGIEDGRSTSQSPENQEPVMPIAGKGENYSQERIQLEEQIKAERVKALNLKRSGKQAEALNALRHAKVLEKKLNSLAS